jgi:hypothetical protein
VLTDCSRSGSAVGERLVPGADVAHFCKPTHVAVLADGSFFVADGYCNSRVLRFDARGAFLSELSSQTRQVHGPPLHVIRQNSCTNAINKRISRMLFYQQTNFPLSFGAAEMTARGGTRGVCSRSIFRIA